MIDVLDPDFELAMRSRGDIERWLERAHPAADSPSMRDIIRRPSINMSPGSIEDEVQKHPVS